MKLLSKKIKYIITDIDDTIAKTYHDISGNMAGYIEKLLKKNVKILMISGQGKDNIYQRVIQYIPSGLRNNIAIAHCNGTELFEFDYHGRLIETPTISFYDELAVDFGKAENVIRTILEKMGICFEYHNLHSISNTLFYAVIENRKVQISIDFFNIPSDFCKWKEEFVNNLKVKLEYENIDVDVKSGGVSAIDIVLPGINKGKIIEKILERKQFIHDLPEAYDEVEVWGDSFLDGSDFDMCKALPLDIKKISFRKVQKSDILSRNNIDIWDGEEELNAGLEEYLVKSLGEKV